MNDELQETLAALASMRLIAEASKAKLATAKDAFERENARIINATKAAASRVEELDAKVRALALATYTESKDKNPAPGINIGIGSKTLLTYDSKTALVWARETGIALTLDIKAFEKVAEATDLNFVTKTAVETQRVAIASDLTKFYPITMYEEPLPLFTEGYTQEEEDA
jgi:hypothetical protein